MMIRKSWLTIPLFALGLAACGDDDGAAPDASAQPIDALQSDTGLPADASVPDAVPPDAFAADCEPVSGTALTAVIIAAEPDVSQPVFVTSPPGDPRLFVVEKCGTIRIIEDGEVLEQPFLDISYLSDNPRVDCTDSEEGLLGLAFHPGYAENGRFFVNYTEQTDLGDGATRNTVVAEYQVSSEPSVAETEEERIIVFHQPESNHNAGMLAFSPIDGYLYIGTGDGGGAGDPRDNGQDNTTILGSMLRIDVDAGDDEPYAVPASNPYSSSANGPEDPRPEIWAIGLRNPWRYSFDRETGDLYIGDVGQGAWEEVNVQPAGSAGGENYGWNLFEGTSCYPEGETDCDPAGMTMPAVEYPHDDETEDKSVTGGYVYRGQCIPDIRGWYIYADFGSHIVRTFEYRDGEAQDHRQLDGVAPGDFGQRIVSFGEDAAGELYVVSLSPDQIRKIVPAPQE